MLVSNAAGHRSEGGEATKEKGPATEPKPVLMQHNG